MRTLSAVDRDRIAELATELGFGDIAERLAHLALPSVRLRCIAGEAPIGATRIGGHPDLPPDIAWPTAAGGVPLVFVAQVVLAGVDRTIWAGAIGLLSFFVQLDPATGGAFGAASVLHLPDDDALAQRSPPAPARHEPLVRPTAVVLDRELTLPTVGVWPAEALGDLGFSEGGDDENLQDAYDELVRRIAHEQARSEHAGEIDDYIEHRFLGWPRHIEGDVLPELVLSYFDQIDYAYESGDLERHAADWRLLLQIDDDERIGTSFGDGGALYFGLPADDLAVGRFDRVQAVSQGG